VGPRRSTTAWIGWFVCDITTGSAGAFVRRTDLRGTVTDLLIGDLFTDRVTKCDPMESMYPPERNRSAIMPARRRRRRPAANELTVPDGFTR
jgi:hypothetical protein